jgi:hypothetical protein
VILTLIELAGFGLVAAGALRVVLTVWPPGTANLPDPSTLPEMAGPASINAAHAALSRQRPAGRPKFRN